MKVYAWLVDLIHRRKNCPTGMISGWVQKVTRHNGVKQCMKHSIHKRCKLNSLWYHVNNKKANFFCQIQLQLTMQNTPNTHNVVMIPGETSRRERHQPRRLQNLRLRIRSTPVRLLIVLCTLAAVRQPFLPLRWPIPRIPARRSFLPRRDPAKKCRQRMDLGHFRGRRVGIPCLIEGPFPGLFRVFFLLFLPDPLVNQHVQLPRTRLDFFRRFMPRILKVLSRATVSRPILIGNWGKIRRGGGALRGGLPCAVFGELNLEMESGGFGRGRGAMLFGRVVGRRGRIIRPGRLRRPSAAVWRVQYGWWTRWGAIVRRSGVFVGGWAGLVVAGLAPQRHGGQRL